MILLLLLIVLLAAIKFWYVTLGTLGLYLAWVLLARRRDALARAEQDRLRHARTRQKIDAIALATSHAMFEAAARHREAIDATAEEVDDDD